MTARRNGSTRRWRHLRAYVLRRDGYTCQMRGPSCTGVATTVDHVVPIALGGALLPPPSELRAACGPCNYAAGGALASRSGRLGDPSRAWL